MPATFTDEEFEAAVATALDSIPDRFSAELENVIFLIQDEPDEEQLDYGLKGTFVACVPEDWEDGICPMVEERGYADCDTCPDPDCGDLLGLYDGVPLTERDGNYGAYMLDMPDTITIFKGPHERLDGSKEEIIEEVRRTVIHEVGHFFGMDEAQIERMGYQ